VKPQLNAVSVVNGIFRDITITSSPIRFYDVLAKILNVAIIGSLNYRDNVYQKLRKDIQIS